jgi:hypothetical protein
MSGMISQQKSRPVQLVSRSMKATIATSPGGGGPSARTSSRGSVAKRSP